MQTQPLAIRRVSLDALHLDPANARSHGERNLESIVSSLQRFGQAEPLIVHAETGRVIGGNGRLMAMRQLGWSECDVVELAVDGIEAAALGIALNRTAELADWDSKALGQLLEQLRAEDALLGVGFEESEVDELLRDLEADSLGSGEVSDPGPQDPPEAPVTEHGDLWLLGSHRILCGDSTNSDDVARLMGGEKAVLLATDPPYLVDYQGKGWDKFEGEEAGVSFFKSFLEACLPHCVQHVPIYQWHAHRRQSLVEQAWKELGLLLHQQLIWVKARAVFTRSHFMWQHEPCFYGWPEGKMPPKERRPACSSTTVWEVDQVGECGEAHPTQKPVELFRRPIEAHTRPGEFVLEPFSGSGTQLITAEETGRRCCAMELSPGYVDAGVLRWQRATGKAATLEATGTSFGEVTRERGRES